MPRIFEQGRAPDIPPRLDGRAVVGVPVRFYRRRVLGLADVCALWIGGVPLFDVTVLDVDGRPAGRIQRESPEGERMYDELRRVLVSEEIRR